MCPSTYGHYDTLTHCRQNELTHTIFWKVLITISGMIGYVI